MAILYPNEIINVYIQGVEFTGNIVSVGQDGNYVYEYNHPQTATINEPSGSLILIYPGYYTVNNTNYDVSNKNFIWRGMGDSTTDVYMVQGLAYDVLKISGTYNYILLENLRMRNDYGADVVSFQDSTTDCNVFINKMYLDHVGGVSNTAILDYYYYQGNAYVTYSYLITGGSYQYKGVSQQDISKIYYFEALEYNKAYGCLYCLEAPNFHTYTEAPYSGYGYNYGDYLVEFNVGPPPPPPLVEPIYSNVWAVTEHIYHTTLSGVAVYNSDASTLIDHIDLPSTPTAVWANDDYIYMSTLASGVYRSTVSGMVHPYIQEPYITSNNTMYLHGADDFLCLATVAGVDRYDLSTASGTTISGASRIFTFNENIHKCYQTTSGTLYYIENNTFLGTDESPTGLGDYLRNWKYYQHLVFTPTTQDNATIRVVFQFDFPYGHTKDGSGADIRFIDDEGNNLSYYIEEWYPNAIITVKVATAGTGEVYMLYGNTNVFTQSNGNDTYFFFDDFTTFDTAIWQVNIGNTGCYVTSNGEYITIHDDNNTGTDIMTKTKVPYGYIRARVRRYGGTSFGQFDGMMGYSTSISSPNWHGSSYLGLSTGTYETAHKLYPYWASSILGTRYASGSWSVWELVCVEGLQRSVYDGETLEATGTGVSLENHLCFHQNNLRTEPDLEVDWVSVESWPLITTYTTTEELLWPLIQPKLHVVYTPTENWVAADYVYEEFYGDPLLLNDIYITEGTSSYNNSNTIFLATDRAAHVIEEHQGDEENADTKRYYIK